MRNLFLSSSLLLLFATVVVSATTILTLCRCKLKEKGCRSSSYFALVITEFTSLLFKVHFACSMNEGKRMPHQQMQQILIHGSGIVAAGWNAWLTHCTLILLQQQQRNARTGSKCCCPLLGATAASTTAVADDVTLVYMNEGKNQRECAAVTERTATGCVWFMLLNSVCRIFSPFFSFSS